MSGPLNMLELFSGTQSFGKVGRELGYNVISVDIEDYKGKHVPTHKCDILEWDYTQYPRDYFDIVHGSPPCVQYSPLQAPWVGKQKRNPVTKEFYTFTQEIRDEELLIADSLVAKTLEIISYFNPRRWTMENPQTGMLKKRDVVIGLPFVDVSYCRYSDYGYKKQTRIWTNSTTFVGKVCDKQCGNMTEDGKKHRVDVSKIGGGSNRLIRYRIPPRLIAELIAD